MTNILSFILIMQPQGEEGSSGIMSFLPLILIVVVFYLFFIRPQMKKSKDQKKFRESLEKGSKVVTIGGIHGRILELGDTTVILDVGNQIRMKFERSAISMNNASELGDKK